jgi:hypothetical protein
VYVGLRKPRDSIPVHAHAIVRAALDFPIMPPPAASTCSGSSIGSFVACSSRLSSFTRQSSSLAACHRLLPRCDTVDTSPIDTLLCTSRQHQSHPSYASSTLHNIACRVFCSLLTHSAHSTTIQSARGKAANFFASSPARDFYTSQPAFTCRYAGMHGCSISLARL